MGRSQLPWSFARIMSGGDVIFSRVDDLPEEAEIDKALLRRHGPRSNASFPLRVGDEVLGALAFGSMRTERGWAPEVLDRLRSVAHMVASVLARRHADQQLQAALDQVRELRERLEQENTYLREQARSTTGTRRLVGQGPSMQGLLSLIERVAPTDAPVLLLGETGVGKELVAEEIHARSTRADRTLVKVNCAALAPTLIEAELFGREKGAYTGALSRQMGRFELAHGSTLFLDEVCELPLDLQAKLLRVLQDGVVRRVGSEQQDATVDVRFVSATNRDPQEAVNAGILREDLFYRLRVVPIKLPPLRERHEDIALLANHFLAHYWDRHREAGDTLPKLTDNSMEFLRTRQWRGNVRELQNVIEHVAVLAEPGQPIQPQDIPAYEDGNSSPARSTISSAIMDEPYHAAKDRLIAEFEREYLSRLSARAGGNMSRAARLANIDRTTLYRLMEKHNVRRDELTGNRE